MKTILSGVFTLWLMGAGVAQGQTKTVRLYIDPHSTVALPDIMKNLVSKCPDTTITIDPQKSDFMLQALGSSGNYKFTVFQRGGTAIYGTTTVTLSNAVKDVCDFVQSPQTQLNIGPAPAANSPPQAANLSADSLNIVSHALTNAADNLLKAANQSDYVQKAIAEIDQALDDAKQAAAHVHDDSGAAVPITSPNFDASPPPAPRTNFMLYASLNSLKSAYDALTRVPAGDLGGYRTRINDDIAAAAEVLVNGIASYNAKHPNTIETPAPASAQSDGESWGEPVDGIQLGLAYSENASALLPVFLPHLEMQIRNMGTHTVNYGCDLGQAAQIEVDGVWYDQASGSFGGSSCPPQPGLAPGTRTGRIPLSLWFYVRRQIVPFDKLNLTPGKHSIRVRASVGDFPVITLVSNSVTVEVPSPKAASDSGALGDAVEGIQLHLAVAKNSPPYVAPSGPGDLPWLEMQIFNKGSGPLTFSCQIGQMSEIEIDGVWYEPGGFFVTATCASPPDLMPGHQSAAIFFALQFLVVNGKSVPFDGFHVGPGKHLVRVRTPSKEFGVENSAHQVITLVSNSVTVEVPSPN